VIEGTAPDVRGDRIEGETRAIVAAAAARIGVPAQDARLLRLHSNATYALPTAGLVVRIATNPDARHRVAAAIAVTRWLASRGFPCVVPAEIVDQPLVEAGRVVSVWRYEATTPESPPAAAELGKLLRDLHSQPDPPYLLDRLADPFASVAAAMAQAPNALPETSRSWLSDRIESLRHWWSATEFPRPPGLIHGDAHTSNVMRALSGGIILGDWDHVAAGPREWDLVQIHYMRRRFGRVTGEDIDAFTAAYGWDVRDWHGLGNLIATREITGLSPYIRTAAATPFSREQLAYRLKTLRSGDVTARWESPPGNRAQGPADPGDSAGQY
jgi:aminoglycoside phosphotransferase (APT) family kinase protein